MGKRIKDTTISEQTKFEPKLRLLVDKMDSDAGIYPWWQAKNMQLKHLGNTYFQGSTNNSTWHDKVVSSDAYIRFSSDAGLNWRDLSTKNVREDTNLYFTESRVLGISDVANAITATHVHTNWDVLQNIIDSGDGLSFLNNAGEYTYIPSSGLATPQTIAYSATPIQDFNLGNNSAITLTGDVTTYTLSNVISGGGGEIAVIQDGTGGYGIAAFAHTGLTVYYINNTIPIAANINSGANAHTILSYKRIGSYLYITFGKFGI